MAIKTSIINLTTKGCQLFYALLLVYFAIKYLDDVERGYFFTIQSLMALQVFAEAGLNVVLLNLAGRESADIKFTNGVISGVKKNTINKVYSILIYSIRWFAIGSVAFLGVASIFGLWYFESDPINDSNISPLISWIFAALCMAIYMPVNSISVIMEGLGQAAYIYKTRLMSVVVAICVAALLFVYGLGMLAVGVMPIVTAIVSGYLMLKKFKALFVEIRFRLDQKIYHKIEDKNKYQTKIALSWMAGFFAFQIYNPVILKMLSPADAGVFGLSMQAINSVGMLAGAIVAPMVPQMLAYVGAGKSKEALEKFEKLFLFSGATYLVFAGILFGLIYGWSNKFDYFSNKFVGLDMMLILLVGGISNHIVGMLSVYLRANLDEPLLMQSLIVAVTTPVLLIVSINYFQLYGAVITYALLSVCVSMLMGVVTFVKVLNENKTKHCNSYI